MDKKESRLTRAKKTRIQIRKNCIYRLTVHRTPKHIYAQVISDQIGNVIVSANTLQSELRAELTNTGNINAASLVGKTIASRAISAGVSKVAFDRSGFKFHGRIKALAESAREAGLIF